MTSVADIDPGSGSTTDVYDYSSSDNRVSAITQGSTTVRSFAYDGAGNIITDTRGSTVYHYHYNNRDRLDQLTIGSTVTADYTYDGLERLAIRTTQNMTPAGTTHYVYDLAGHLIAEASDTGSTVREYIWLDDMPLAVVADLDTASPNLYFVHVDHLNRPIEMTDTAKNVVWQAHYWPFGEAYSVTGAASNNLRFPGQYFLLESGLAYNWYRQYDPVTGRRAQVARLIGALAALGNQRRHDFCVCSTTAQSRNDTGLIGGWPVLADFPFAFDARDRDFEPDDGFYLRGDERFGRIGHQPGDWLRSFVMPREIVYLLP